jgi:hypothetical protein
MSTRYQKSYAEIITKLSNELEKYKSRDRGKLVVDLIRALAKIYINADKDSTTDKADVLHDIKELILDYDAELTVSEVGSEYSRKHHKPSREPWVNTDDKAMDGKIAQSVEAGLKLGSDVLVLETVKLFKFESEGDLSS